jgi:translation initiation factor IF-2
MRVHELAKDFDMSSSKLVEEIKSYGIVVKSHLSGLDDDQVASIRQKHIMGQVVIKLETDLQERQKEKTEEENNSGGISGTMTETSGDVTAEQVSMEEVEKEIAKNVEAAGKAREEYAKSKPVVLGEDEEITLTESDLDEESFDEYEDTDLSFGQKAFAKAEEGATTVIQEVEVERSTGFFAWLKRLFS